jgi:hypothetical protein
MKRLSTPGTVYRVFVRSVPRATIEDQKARAAVVCGLGASPIVFGPDQLEDWYSIARPDDVLVVDCLEIIPPPRSKKQGVPTALLGQVLGFIRANKLTLIEARTGREPDAKRIREATMNVARGRRLTTATARELGRKGGEKKPVQTILDYWMNHPEKSTFSRIWRGTEGTYADALDAVNEAAARQNYIAVSSTTMAWRVFGHRTRKR